MRRQQPSGTTHASQAWFAQAAKLLLALTIGCSPVFAQTVPQPKPTPTPEEQLLEVMHSISSHTIFDYVKELASEKYQGRLTGTPEYNASGRWAAGLFRQWGVAPKGEAGDFFQHFPNPYTRVLPGGYARLHIAAKNNDEIVKNYVYQDEFFPGGTSDSGEVKAEVVYVGYGITAPELGYDDYKGVDVKGKIVLMEREIPTDTDNESEFIKWRPYSFHDYKVKNAAAHGAAGMVYNYLLANPNAVFIKRFVITYVGSTVVNDLFAGSGKDHKQVVTSIEKTLTPASFSTGKVMSIKSVTEHHPEGIGVNVVGFLPGKDAALAKQTIIIGAHLDHLGMSHEMMPGANDDASGVAVLLGVAEALAKSPVPLKRSVLFILFGAEEQGVKGSEYYVAHPVVPNTDVVGFLNLESVGRGEKISAGSATNFPNLWAPFEKANRAYIHRTVTPNKSRYVARPRQDAAHFFWAGIPTISFGTSGAKELPFSTYHTTYDTPEIITPEIMEDLARLVFMAVEDIANS